MSTELRWGDLIVRGNARRRRVRATGHNGVDGVEVRDDGRELVVYFLEHTPPGLEHENIRIDAPAGGLHVRATRVRRERLADHELEDRLIVELDAPGTAGRYRLSVVERQPDALPGRSPYRELDPRYAEAAFVFDVDAPVPAIKPSGGEPAAGDDGISYLGRDFAGLTKLMLDRMAVTVPGWTERHEPDMWVALIELLAYVGDDLSYYEDAVATEAYLQTARMRVSVKRHARLVDYRLHDGCAARGWVCVEVSSPLELATDTIGFVAIGAIQAGGAPVIDWANVDPLTRDGYQQYSPLPPPADGATTPLRPAHNEIRLWSWGESDSRLVVGATRAVLIDAATPAAILEDVEGDGSVRKRALELRIGDVLVLEETADPATGGQGPADPTLRQAVRLTGIERLHDDLYELPLVEIRWATDDALRFELAVTASGRFCARASGNALLVAHGRSVQETVDVGALSLSQLGLSFSTPFPDPAAVAARQAQALRELDAAWRDELERWVAEAERGTPLSREQLQSLRDQFGETVLADVGLAPGEGDEGDSVRAAVGLAELLARGERLIADSLRRADVLARLAEATGPLDAILLEELDDDWGRELGDLLRPDRPGTWGPVATALVQDPTTALPLIQLTDPSSGTVWSPALDLIGVAPTDRAVVADVDNQGVATLRVSAPPEPLTR